MKEGQNQFVGFGLPQARYIADSLRLQLEIVPMTEAVNAALAFSESQWESWYEEAKTTSDLEQSYDDEGNIIG